MALAELVSRGTTVDPDHSSGPVCDVTLIIHANPTHPTSPATDDPATTNPATNPAEDPADDLDRLDDLDLGDVRDLRDLFDQLTSTDPNSPTDPTGPNGSGHPADPERSTGPGGPSGLTGMSGMTGLAGSGRSGQSPGPASGCDPDGATGPVDGWVPRGPNQRRPTQLHPTHPLLDHCGPATTPDGFPVADHIAQPLLCDPAIVALITDTLGVPLDLGRTTRLANRAQRRALAHRDGGCVFPGCDMPVTWCDAHHVNHWNQGGTTDIAHLALLCRYHHGVTHRHGWTMTTQPNQTFTWTTPHGHTLHSQRHRGRSPTAGILQPT
jgi:hypothetical protein